MVRGVEEPACEEERRGGAVRGICTSIDGRGSVN